MRSTWPSATAGARSSATAAARPRTRPSPTWRSPPAPARSRRGAPSRCERVAKYNRLLRIEAELGEAALFPGLAALPPLGLSRFIDRGAIVAGWIGLGTAVVLVIAFGLVVPIQPVVFVLALPVGLLIGWYANAKSERRRPRYARAGERALGGPADRR